MLKDPKNRRRHVIYLSDQAAADEHYTYTEDRLREAWKAVADFIEAAK